MVHWWLNNNLDFANYEKRVENKIVNVVTQLVWGMLEVCATLGVMEKVDGD